MQVLAPYLKNLWVLHEILATYPYQLFVHQSGHPSANFSLSFFLGQSPKNMSTIRLTLNLTNPFHRIGAPPFLRNGVSDRVLGSAIVLGSIGSSFLMIFLCPCNLLIKTVASAAKENHPYTSCIP